MPSSVVSKIGYDAEHKILSVVFVSGKIYYYMDVPSAVYTALKNSRSKGRYLNQYIKGHYDYEHYEQA